MPWKETELTIGEGEDQKKVKVIDRDSSGNPIWVHEADGKEVGVEAEHMFSKIPSLIQEKKDLKDAKKELEGQLQKIKDQFKDITDPKKALEALEVVQNLSDKKLIDAKKVDELRQQLKQEYDADLEKKMNEHNDIVSKLQGDLDQSRKGIHKLTISNAFKSSPVLNGPNKSVTIPVEMSEKYWGDYFKPEEVNGVLKPVGYIGGNPIYSDKKVGELADFDEAIQKIIASSPFKDDITKGNGQSGGGSGGAEERVHESAKGMESYTTLADFKSPIEKQQYIDKFGLDKYQEIVKESRRQGQTLNQG